MISTEQIKELRNKTNISVMACKNALEKAGGDLEKALRILREEGAEIAEKKSERAVKAGIIDSYIHATKQIGVLIEIRCETDFVAKNEDFQKFVHNIAMHITASAPTSVEDLLDQNYIKNPQITVNQYLKDTIQKFGENIEISRFIRYSLK
ncbi:MAG: translation elongation factor Ts [Patescibacteria group bacterium]